MHQCMNDDANPCFHLNEVCVRSTVLKSANTSCVRKGACICLPLSRLVIVMVAVPHEMNSQNESIESMDVYAHSCRQCCVARSWCQKLDCYVARSRCQKLDCCVARTHHHNLVCATDVLQWEWCMLTIVHVT
jgi:hypothetical protein